MGYYRRCQTVTAVWSYICRATYWAILPIWAAMLQWKMADPTWPTWWLGCILATFGGARLAATATQPILKHQFLFMCMSILWFHWQISGNFLLWEVIWAQKVFFPLILVFVNCHSDIKMAISLEWHNQILTKIWEFSILVVIELCQNFIKIGDYDVPRPPWISMKMVLNMLT